MTHPGDGEASRDSTFNSRLMPLPSLCEMPLMGEGSGDFGLEGCVLWGRDRVTEALDGRGALVVEVGGCETECRLENIVLG